MPNLRIGMYGARTHAGRQTITRTARTALLGERLERNQGPASEDENCRDSRLAWRCRAKTTLPACNTAPPCTTVLAVEAPHPSERPRREPELTKNTTADCTASKFVQISFRPGLLKWLSANTLCYHPPCAAWTPHAPPRLPTADGCLSDRTVPYCLTGRTTFSAHHAASCIRQPGTGTGTVRYRYG